MKKTHVFGIGSHQGDDQLGWRVVELLALRRPELPGIRLQSPADLLHCTEGADAWVLVDACVGQGAPGNVHSWDWPMLRDTRTRFAGTHELGILDALRIAEELSLLPPSVTIWAGEIEAEQLGPTMSRRGEELAELLAARVLEELSAPARNEIHA